jgi:Ca2+-binding EF-hand superfamily protein
MKLHIFGGVVLAALFAPPAVSQTAPATPQHHRPSFFTSNQNRSDIAARVARMFKPLDLNHDGFVTRDEIASSEARFQERMTKNAPKRAARMFDRLDANHDAEITRAEFDAAHKARGTGKQAKSSRRPSLFARADANSDGIVTRAEFESATASGKVALRHGHMRGNALVRLFEVADANKDGRVSLAEAQQAALQQFDAADLNHDGVLTPDERKQARKAERAKHRAA